MGNPYQITLDSAWAKWATEHGLSETVTAALFLLSEKRKADELVDKLKPNEFELVIEVVQHSPECFPPGPTAYISVSAPRPRPMRGRSRVRQHMLDRLDGRRGRRKD